MSTRQQLKNHSVTKDNKIIEASYRLTLSEQRLILCCISKIDSRRALSADRPFELSAQEFASAFGISEDRAYSELKLVADRLFERYLVIQEPDLDEDSAYTKTRWVSSISYIPNRGIVRLYFAPKIIPYLSALEREFTSYKLAFVSRMTSNYGIRLYELLVQWHNLKSREIELAWLRQQFQIEDKYAALKDFKRRVLEPAVADVNDHSDYWVKWTQRKTGRMVTHLCFTFGLKEEKPKSVAQPRKISQAEIQRLARPGESWEEAEARIRGQ